MRKIAILIASLLPVIAFAQNVGKEAEGVVDHQELRSGSGGVVYLAGSDEPYTGLVRDFYPNGQRESESSYVDGKQDGIDTEWYDDGQKKAERTWALGQRVHEIQWWENGQKRHESKYVDGKLHGGTSWFEDGNKRKEDVWVDGQRKSQTEWHENGNKKSEEFYVAGRKDGQFTAWYENGQMQVQAQFSEGTPHGNVTTWDPEGRKRLVENYVHGKKDGVRIEWHENGQMRTEELYRAGQRKVLKRWDVHGNILVSWPEENAQDDTSANDNAVRMEQLKKRGGRFYEKGSDAPYSGAVKDYYPNGNKKSSLTLVDGKLVGRQFMWHASGTIEGKAEFDTDGTGYGKECYEDGQKKSEMQTHNGKAHGTSTTWHPNGQKKSEETHFRNGWPTTGTATTWHENGKMKYQETWGGGSMREKKCWDEEGTEIDGSCRR
ncbi:MAG: toxin-antitoxin system YwqK family antitoxin [Gammaproteobacteria bacterium]|nr:toxin-antitoxin system YwqK family antitoxin [Gammaproteobacteria bacterium]